MAHNYRSDGPGGISHVVLATGILLGVALYGHFPEQVAALFGNDSGPRMLVADSAGNSKCARESVETVIGTLGCAGARRAAHLAETTLVRQ